MSKSTKGTKKTSSSIDQDSERYIDRSNSFMEKRGSKAAGTDAAHILSWGLTDAIETHTRGRPKGEEARTDVARALNSATNLRIKTVYGNVVLDERRDARIANAYVTGSAIEGGTTTQRASQAYRASQRCGDPLESITRALGGMNVLDPETNRTHKLKNHEKHESRHGR